MTTILPRATIVIPGCAFHVPQFLSPSDADQLGAAIVEETHSRWVAQLTYNRGWPARMDKGHSMARFGDSGVTYTYKDKPKPMYPFTPALSKARELVAQALDWRPNCVVVNAYAPGSGLYPHRDGKYIPQLGDSPTIAALSFGCARTFLLYPADPATNKRIKGAEPVSVQLANGDLFVMHGRCDVLYHHSIPEEPERVGTRLSLTFRKHTQ